MNGNNHAGKFPSGRGRGALVVRVARVPKVPGAPRVPRVPRVPRAVVLGAGLAFAAAARAAAAQSASVQDSPAWPEAASVGDVLRIETQETLARLRQRGRGDTAIAPSSSALDDRVDLAAIYGVGRRLNVELMVNGQRKRYAHGNKWPEGSANAHAANEYALATIDGKCVRLDRGSAPRTVCLKPTRQE